MHFSRRLNGSKAGHAVTLIVRLSLCHAASANNSNIPKRIHNALKEEAKHNIRYTFVQTQRNEFFFIFVLFSRASRELNAVTVTFHSSLNWFVFTFCQHKPNILLSSSPLSSSLSSYFFFGWFLCQRTFLSFFLPTSVYLCVVTDHIVRANTAASTPTDCVFQAIFFVFVL